MGVTPPACDYGRTTEWQAAHPRVVDNAMRSFALGVVLNTAFPIAGLLKDEDTADEKPAAATPNLQNESADTSSEDDSCSS